MNKQIPGGSTNSNPHGGVPASCLTGYVRVVALGDSATYGLGDRVGDHWRGWAAILTEAIGTAHHISFCNLAQSGATVRDVRGTQLGEALDHRPQVASLVVGINDVMRSSWDPSQTRADLLDCVEALTKSGAIVVTVRFHDHSRVLGLPRWLARPMRERIEELNEIYDEVCERFGCIQIDLEDLGIGAHRGYWAIDRLHPSELGHRLLARNVAEHLNSLGLAFDLPLLAPTASTADRRQSARILLAASVPWLVRRARDLGPWTAARILHSARSHAATTALERA
jgi:lysophospholipase L1-like esterase